MKKIMIRVMAAVGLWVLFVASSHAEKPMLNDPVPATHTVVKGDTLWDISATFLKNPWMWPEIWHVNTQIANPHLIYPGDVIRLIYVDGQPRLTLDTSGRVYKMSPKARVITASEAIETIPLEKINNFLSRSRVVTEDEILLSPYVVAGSSEHIISGAGDKVYVRGEVAGEHYSYGVFREGEVFKDPLTDEVLGIQAMDIGSGDISAIKGEIATLEVSRTTQEIRSGDRLLRQEERALNSNFYPSSAGDDVEGLILAVEGGVTQVGKMDVVVINKGEREHISAGNVFAVYKKGAKVKDRIKGGFVELPDERAGLIMVFRVFEKVSFGLVLEANMGLKVKDIIRNPDL